MSGYKNCEHFFSKYPNLIKIIKINQQNHTFIGRWTRVVASTRVQIRGVRCGVQRCALEGTLPFLVVGATKRQQYGHHPYDPEPCKKIVDVKMLKCCLLSMNSVIEVIRS